MFVAPLKRHIVIDIEQITINLAMPSNELRIVAMQPFIMLDPTIREPFRWSNDAVATQLTAVHRTLDIAKSGLSGRSANFTLFPEYAIPGTVGAVAINDRISSGEWPNGSIIIAGLHGMLKDEYTELCDVLAANVSVSNSPNSVLNNQWVNCCVIWVKDREGVVRKWVQPKVRPAWPEMQVTCNDMFCGSTVYVFDCQYEPSGFPCRFATLICYDWVASVAGSTVSHELLSRLTELRTPNPTPLDWVFVVQHNPNPNHQSFLQSTYRFLTDTNTHPFIERGYAAVVHINTAVSPIPARTGSGGFSACVFSPNVQFDCNSCRPTVCMQTSSLRGSSILERCKDIVFREMGECIHAFTVRVPRFVTPDVTDRTYPVPIAHVYAVSDSNDPRLSGGPVPAAVKWVSDALDRIERASAIALAGCHLKVKAETIEPEIFSAMRSSDGHAATDSVNWATCSFSRGNEFRTNIRRLNPDIWGADETEALQHVLHSLTSLGCAYRLEFENAVLHCAVGDNENFVQVVAIRGDTHQDCRYHYDNYIPHRGADPVLVIARDRDNLIPTPEEHLRFDETAGEGAVAFLDYQTLINTCRQATNSRTLKRHLDGILPKNNRII